MDLKTLFFVDLMALEDGTTALHGDAGNQIPGDAASRPRRTDVSFHTPVKTSEFAYTADCRLSGKYVTGTTWLELVDSEEYLLFLLPDDESRTSFWKAVRKSIKSSSDNGQC